MTNHKQNIIFGLAIAVLVSALLFSIYQQETILRRGVTTILETRPVDPRDLFRGEYVILRYEIEREKRVLAVANDLPDGTPVYVNLVEDAKRVARVRRVRELAPESFNDGLWIKGEVDKTSWETIVRFPSIEQFYVPEGSGTPIERLDNVHVAVTLREGEARVVNLLDGNLNVIDPKSYIKR